MPIDFTRGDAPHYEEFNLGDGLCTIFLKRSRAASVASPIYAFTTSVADPPSGSSSAARDDIATETRRIVREEILRELNLRDAHDWRRR